MLCVGHCACVRTHFLLKSMRVKGHMQIQVKSVCFTGVNQWRRKIFLQMNMWLQAHFAISSSRILKNLGWGGGGGGGLHTLVPTPMYVCKVWGIHNCMLQIDGVT